MRRSYVKRHQISIFLELVTILRTQKSLKSFFFYFANSIGKTECVYQKKIVKNQQRSLLYILHSYILNFQKQMLKAYFLKIFTLYIGN